MDPNEAVANSAIHTIRTADDPHSPGLMSYVLVTAHMLTDEGAYDNATRVLAAWAEVTGLDQPGGAR